MKHVLGASRRRDQQVAQLLACSRAMSLGHLNTMSPAIDDIGADDQVRAKGSCDLATLRYAAVQTTGGAEWAGGIDAEGET
jgi:hypothetical protein